MQIPGGGLNQAAGLAQQRQAAFLGQLLPEQTHPARRGVDAVSYTHLCFQCEGRLRSA